MSSASKDFILHRLRVNLHAGEAQQGAPALCWSHKNAAAAAVVDSDHRAGVKNVQVAVLCVGFQFVVCFVAAQYCTAELADSLCSKAVQQAVQLARFIKPVRLLNCCCACRQLLCAAGRLAGARTWQSAMVNCCPATLLWYVAVDRVVFINDNLSFSDPF